MKIVRPSVEQVEKYLAQWDSSETAVLESSKSSSLRKLFEDTYPRNVYLDDVLIKVSSLNNLYSTNIFSPLIVAKHIVGLDIDSCLSKGDLTLVNDIAVVKVDGEKTINFYSFATKYCSFHVPEHYPIYDSFVGKMLMHFKQEDQFFSFKKDDLKRYPRFHKVLVGFRGFYGLARFTMKEIDKYLWLAGKENFPRQNRK